MNSKQSEANSKQPSGTLIPLTKVIAKMRHDDLQLLIRSRNQLRILTVCLRAGLPSTSYITVQAEVKRATQLIDDLTTHLELTK